MEQYKGVTVASKKRMVRIQTEDGEQYIGVVVEELLELTTPEGKEIIVPAKDYNFKNVSHADSADSNCST